MPTASSCHPNNIGNTQIGMNNFQQIFVHKPNIIMKKYDVIGIFIHQFGCINFTQTFFVVMVNVESYIGFTL